MPNPDNNPISGKGETGTGGGDGVGEVMCDTNAQMGNKTHCTPLYLVVT